MLVSKIPVTPEYLSTAEFVTTFLLNQKNICNQKGSQECLVVSYIQEHQLTLLVLLIWNPSLTYPDDFPFAFQLLNMCH
jgi:hypothetical protein